MSLERPAEHVLLEGSLGEGMAHFAGHAGGIVDFEAGLLCVASPLPHIGPLFNAALRLEQDLRAATALAKAEAFCSENNRDMALWASDADGDLQVAATEAGFSPVESQTAPGMLLRRADYAGPDDLDRQVEEVTGNRGVAGFQKVVTAAFRELRSEGSTTGGGSPPSGALLAPEVFACLLLEEDDPVACGMSIRKGETASLYLIGTVQGARQQGLGTRITQALVTQAFRTGAHQVVLHSSPMATRLYHRVGFSAVATFTLYT